MRLFGFAGLIAVAVVSATPTAVLAATGAPTAVASRTAVAAASNPTGDVFDVACPSAKNCLAVGEDWNTYRPLVENWNGARWSATVLPLPSGQTTSVLTGVSCATPKSCVVVGGTAGNYLSVASYKSLAESWNGRSWTRLSLPNPSGGYGYEFSAVSCPTAKNCVVTGAYILSGSGRTAGYAEVLSGGKWKVYKLPGVVSSSRNSIIQQLSCISVTSCVAVGSYGNSTTPIGSPANGSVAEFWNGKRWSDTMLATPAGSKGAWLYGLSCTRSRFCLAVGGRRLANGKITPLAEAWSAATGRWKAAFPSATGSDPVLENVSCTSAARCLAVGGGDEATAKTSPFSASWNGKTWKYQEFPAPLGGDKEASDAYNVTCVSATDCVAVADTGSAPEYSPNPSNYRAYGVSAFWNGKAWRLVPVASA
jgi:hypothetical protein